MSICAYQIRLECWHLWANCFWWGVLGLRPILRWRPCGCWSCPCCPWWWGRRRTTGGCPQSPRSCLSPPSARGSGRSRHEAKIRIVHCGTARSTRWREAKATETWTTGRATTGATWNRATAVPKTKAAATKNGNSNNNIDNTRKNKQWQQQQQEWKQQQKQQHRQQQNNKQRQQRQNNNNSSNRNDSNSKSTPVSRKEPVHAFWVDQMVNNNKSRETKNNISNIISISNRNMNYSSNDFSSKMKWINSSRKKWKLQQQERKQQKNKQMTTATKRTTLSPAKLTTTAATAKATRPSSITERKELELYLTESYSYHFIIVEEVYFGFQDLKNAAISPDQIGFSHKHRHMNRPRKETICFRQRMTFFHFTTNFWSVKFKALLWSFLNTTQTMKIQLAKVKLQFEFCIFC